MAENDTILSTDNDNSEIIQNDVIEENIDTKEPEVSTEHALKFSEILSDEGFFNDDWKSCLSDDMKNDPSLQSIKSLPSLVKSYIHAQKAIGSNKMVIPGDRSTAEEWDEAYKALGRPDDPSEYKFSAPEGIEADEARISEFADLAHKLGLNQNQFQMAVAAQLEKERQEFSDKENQLETMKQETIASLKKEYGSSFNDIIRRCQDTVTKLNLNKLLQKVPALGNDFDFIKALAEIGDKIYETPLKGIDSSIGGNIQSRIDEIEGNMKGPLYDETHPLHAKTVEELHRLYTALNH